jgi:hypothetical protein
LSKKRKIKKIAKAKLSLEKRQKISAKSGQTQGQLSNPFSTGGGGVMFENDVQAGFVVSLLASSGTITQTTLPREIQEVLRSRVTREQLAVTHLPKSTDVTRKRGHYVT